MYKILTKRNTIIAVAILTLWRLYLSATLQLHPDEAYYWLWSRCLDLGYFDHSPMLAYFIRLTTLLSQGEMWVRLSGVLGAVVMSYVAWRLAQRFTGREDVAAASVIVLNIMPLTMSGTIIMTPDIPAFLFWTLCVYIYWQLVSTQKTGYWYLLGICFGLGLLSKYTAVLLLPSLFLFMLLTDERKHLKTIHPYLACLIGFLFFIPVVYWNSQHGWISFKFQMGHGLGGQSYSIGRVFEYFGGQALIASPILWLAGMYAGFVYLFKKDKEKLFLALTSMPLILFFAYSSLKKLAGPNWPAFAYLTFSIMVSWYLLEGGRARKILLCAGMSFCLIMSLLATLHARFGVIPLARFSTAWAQADATNFFYGWKELAAEIEKKPETKFILTSSHTLGAEVAYYTQGRVYSHVDLIMTRYSQYNLWDFPESLKSSDGVYVYVVEGDAFYHYADFFASVGSTDSLTVTRNGNPLRTYKMINGHGYKYTTP